MLWAFTLSLFLSLSLLAAVSARPGVADPVKPCYNHSLFPSFYEQPQIPDDLLDVDEYARRGGAGVSRLVCMSNTHSSVHSKNRVFDGYTLDDLQSLPHYLTGTTYWLNEYLHAGHVHYDISLIQILSMVKIDRIVVQRAICHARLCDNLGHVESFYKGYFTAILEAFNQSDVPIYVRYSGSDQVFTPLYFSSHSPTFFQPAPSAEALSVINSTEELRYRPLPVHKGTCFERVIRRADYRYGAVPTVSKRAVQRFQATAYSMLRNNNHTGVLPPLTTYFPFLSPPYRILFSYRGPQSPSRRITNQDELVKALQMKFRTPQYELVLFNNADPTLDFEAQLHAVASAHVVLTNHGAFEGNMIYMKNSSLLLEIFGDYGNNEIHTFHRLALMFGVFYARVQPRNNTDHLIPSFVLFEDEITEIVGIIDDYFVNKHFRHNMINAD